MIIKPARGRDEDLAALLALREGSGISPTTRQRIDAEMRKIRAGERGEREASYEIDFHHGPSRHWAVIHDLRIEHEGRVAQIDHLLIGRFLDIWVCETKHFSSGFAVNEQGEFTRFYNHRPTAMPSPIEQNRKHVSVLSAILGSDKIAMPTRLGIALRPQFHDVVLISQNARIARPTRTIDGLDSVVKSDQLRTLIERRIDETSPMSALMSIGRFLTGDGLEAFARQVARLHRPANRDWTWLATGEPVAEAARPSTRERTTPSPSQVDAVTTPERPSDPDLIPTSKWGAALGLPNVEAALIRLVEEGMLERVDDGHRLTAAGLAAGARFVPKSRHGPYFLWPRTLRCRSIA